MKEKIKSIFKNNSEVTIESTKTNVSTKVKLALKEPVNKIKVYKSVKKSELGHDFLFLSVRNRPIPMYEVGIGAKDPSFDSSSSSSSTTPTSPELSTTAASSSVPRIKTRRSSKMKPRNLECHLRSGLLSWHRHAQL